MSNIEQEIPARATAGGSNDERRREAAPGTVIVRKFVIRCSCLRRGRGRQATFDIS
jgi:hypothetical protein